jgi:hypothetical protein
MKLFREYIERRGYSWRTIRRAMERGDLPLAYTTKGGQWRFRRPRGASQDEIVRWLIFDGGNAKRRCSPQLRQWLNAVEIHFPHKQPKGDFPRRGEMKDLEVKGIAWAWLYDAQRWFRQMENKRPIDKMSKEELSAVLEAVWPVRDEIVAWERAYAQKIGAVSATPKPAA